MRITRGINDPVVSYRFMLSFEPREVFNLSGRDVYLIIAWRGLTIEKNSIANSDVKPFSCLWAGLQNIASSGGRPLRACRACWHRGLSMSAMALRMPHERRGR
jgi:hypothetical protein